MSVLSLDTVVLLGGISGRYPGEPRAFIALVMSAIAARLLVAGITRLGA